MIVALVTFILIHHHWLDLT